ncbi:MAG: EH signature domain-containing protein, partial [Epsilonproteobacteria bacterium]|nr:EH signature domain-containing protein [Campylobacterota bacterium]
KIQEYSGKRKMILNIRENSNFFLDRKGAVKLSLNLLSHSEDLPDICTHLKLPKHMKHYEYFSEVAAAFVHFALRKPSFEDLISHIIDFLHEHRDLKTAKKCLSKIILKLAQSFNLELQEDVKKVSLELIGDPINDALWAPWQNATREDIKELRNAQQILNEWINRQFINIFFQKISMNDDRRNFWLRYIKHISRFKIYSHKWVYNTLAYDIRIKDSLKERFGFIQGVDRNQSALILFIKDYLFIEFSQTGNALYIYKPGTINRPDVSKESIHRSDLCRHDKSDLIIKKYDKNHFYRGYYSQKEKMFDEGRYVNSPPNRSEDSLAYLIRKGYYSQKEKMFDEGRYVHSPPNGWEDRLAYWIRNKLGITV